jgi:hypothetical protein
MIDISQWRAAIGRWHSRNTLVRVRCEHSISHLLHISLLLFVILILLVILICSGDVELNPGPNQNESTGITICHINARSLTAEGRLDLIEQFLGLEIEYDVICITETHLDNNVKSSDLKINSYQELIRRDRNRMGGGVAVYVREGLVVKHRTDLESHNIEAVWIEIEHRCKAIIIGVIYRPPNSSANDCLEFIDQLQDTYIKALSSKPKSVIMIGDFNDRCKTWSSDHTLYNSDLGNQLVDFTNSNNLCQMIDEPTRGESLLDLIITNTPSFVSRHGVLPPPDPDLDHNLIYLELDYVYRKNTKTMREIWLYDRADYNGLNYELNEINWDVIINDGLFSINEIVDKTTNIILNLARKYIPNKIITINSKDKPGMTSHVKKLFKQCHRLHARSMKTGNANDRDNFRNKRKEAKTAWRKAKCDYYDKINIQLHESTNSDKYYWKLIKSLTNSTDSQSVNELHENNKAINCHKQIAAVLNKYFSDQQTVDNSNDPEPAIDSITNVELSDIQCTPGQVFDILAHLNINKASGPDGISNRLLKEIRYSISIPLSKIINLSLRTAFPDVWKNANVVPLHKKGDRKIKENYRPVSLLNCLSKIQERIVYITLYKHCCDNNLLDPNNSGFKKNDSTVNRLLQLTHNIYTNFDNKQDTYAVFLDISKAFDKVWHNGLLSKLYSFGITGNLLQWFRTYLSNRKQRVIINGHTSEFLSIKAGVPQGSLLGPLLFLIYINDMTSTLASNTSMFADDTAIYTSNKNVQMASEALNSDLEKIHNWANIWKVSFNASKTYLMHFTLSTNKPALPPIYLNNSEIKEIDSFKYLGLTLTKRLSWKNHLLDITKKANNKLHTFWRIKSFTSRKTLSLLYITYVRPILEYGCAVFDNCTAFESNMLENVQRKFALLCTGAYRHTSNNKLMQELGWETLQTRRKYHKLCLFYKIHNRLTPTYLNDLLPPMISQIHNYNTRQSDKYYSSRTRTTAMQTSYFNHSARSWDALPSAITESESLSIFKSRLKRNLFINIPNKLYSHFIDKEQIQLARLRMGLSALNYHRFTYNFIDSPKCTRCNTNSDETLIHFFLECPSYAASRLPLLSALRNLLPFNIVQNQNFLVKSMIFGNPSLPEAENIIILKNSMLYIAETKRFMTSAD